MCFPAFFRIWFLDENHIDFSVHIFLENSRAKIEPRAISIATDILVGRFSFYSIHQFERDCKSIGSSVFEMDHYIGDLAA